MKQFRVTIFFVVFAMLSASAAETNAPVPALVGDGATVNTAVIQQLIDDRSAAGGGAVRLPAGRFVVGTIQLKDNVTLELDAQTTLLGSTNVVDYRNVDPFTDGSGTSLGHALIVADGVTNVGVTGAGSIDGRGRELKATQKSYAIRPFLMRWLNCTNVTVRDVHLTNPGAWTLSFFQTRNAVVERVTIRTREKRLHNNDGIDLDSCEVVRIRDCDIESGDDALCLKATSTQPCRDIVASGCKLATRCNDIKLGTESIGDFENITITNCEIRDTEMAGIALYDVDGAQMHHINIGDLTMSNVVVAVSIRLGARLKTFRAGDQPRPVGQLRDVNIHDVRATDVKQIGLLINGIPGHPIENLAFENLAIEVPGGGSAANALVQLGEHESAYPEFSMFGKTFPAYGAYVRHARGVSFQNVRITPTKADARPANVFVDVEGVMPVGFEQAGGPPTALKITDSYWLSFGSNQPAHGFRRVALSEEYSTGTGLGFEPGTNVLQQAGFITSDQPFLFSGRLPEGNHRVIATFGDEAGATTNTVKAEARRLMVEEIRTEKGRVASCEFVVNTRTSKYPGGKVHLKKRELDTEMVTWDDKLTLEFNGARSGLRTLEILPAPDVPTVYLAGDSTVCDQPLEPWNSWGQMLPRFLKPGIAVANYAESGESLRSFNGAKRTDKILSVIKTNDFLLIQFGHNDQKDKTPGAGAFTTYTEFLKQAVADARAHGARPVLVTSVNRLKFDASGHHESSLGDFPEAVRRVAAAEHVPLIDLHAMSKTLYEAFGPKDAKILFQDPTHHNNFGSYEVAKCVVEGIRANVPELAPWIAADVTRFDPAHPDAPEKFSVPASAAVSTEKPEGN